MVTGVTNKTASIILKYQIDRASVAQVEAANAKLTGKIQDSAKAVGSIEDAAGKLNNELVSLARDQSVDRLADEFRVVESSVGDTGLALEYVARQLKAIGATDSEIKRVASGIADIQTAGSQRTLGQRVTKFGRDIFNAPAVGPSTPIARGLIAAGPVIDKLGVSVGQLGAIAGVAGVSVAAVAIALDRFNKGLEDSKRQLTAALEAQDRYYDLIGTATSTQAREQIADIERTRDAQRQQIEETRTALESAFEQVQRIAFGQVTFLGDAAARLFDNQLPTAQLRERLEELQAEFDANEQTIARLRQGLEAGVFITNDAAEAERRLAEQRARTANADIDALLQADRMTAQQRQDRINELNREIQIITQVAKTSDLSTESMREFSTRVAELQREQGILEAQTRSTADAIAEQTEQTRALEDAAKRYEQAVSRNIQAQLAGEEMTREEREERIQAIRREQDILERAAESSGTTAAQTDELRRQIRLLGIEEEVLLAITYSRADALADEAARQEAVTEQTKNYLKALEDEGKVRAKIADLAAKENAARDDYRDRIEELDIEEGERRTEAIADAADERTKIEEDAADRMLEIQRRLAKDFTRAVAERDALAAFQAREDAAEEARKEQAERDKRLRQVQADLDKELQQLARHYDKREAEEARRLSREIAVIQQANAALQADLVNAQNAQLAIAANGSNGLLQIEQNFWTQRMALAQSMASNYAAYNAVNTPPNYVTPNYVTMTAAQARQYLGLDSYVDRRFDTRMGDYLQYNNRGR